MASKFIHRNSIQRDPIATQVLDDRTFTKRKLLASQVRIKPNTPRQSNAPIYPSDSISNGNQDPPGQTVVEDDARSELWANTTIGDDSETTTIAPSSPMRDINHDESPPVNAPAQDHPVNNVAYDDQRYPVAEGKQTQFGRYENQSTPYGPIAHNGNEQPHRPIEVATNHFRGRSVNLSHRGRPIEPHYQEPIRHYKDDSPSPNDIPDMNIEEILDARNAIGSMAGYQQFQENNHPSQALQSLLHGQSRSGRFENPLGTPGNLKKRASERATLPQFNQRPHSSSAAQYPSGPMGVLPLNDDNGFASQSPIYSTSYTSPLAIQDNVSNQTDGQEHNKNESDANRDRFAASEGEPEDLSRDGSPSPHNPRVTASEKRTSVPRLHEKKRQAIELDYAEDSLRKMNFDDLKSQPFDSNPRVAPSKIPENLLAADRPGKEATLETRLEYYKSKHVTAPEKQQFFASLSIDDWEEAGDWFLGHFGRIMNELKEARKQRRQISRLYEKEISDREEIVKAGTESLDEEMKAMKVGGLKVLRGKVTA